jgi:cardiolipin synthase A/B
MTAGEASPRPSATDDSSILLRRTLEGVIGVPATEGNRIDVLRNGVEIFPAMLEAIDQAEHTIDFLTFVYWQGEIGTAFANALAGRAKAGARVRVLLDGWGAHPIDRSSVELMKSAGVLVRWFRPLRRFEPAKMNHRTHRKVMVVDESVGFTGGVGIADVWDGDARDESEWRDTHFRVRGPAVDGLRGAFLDNWVETNARLFEPGIDRFPAQPQLGNSVVQCVRGASEAGWSDISTLLLTLLQRAERRVRIATAYFVPDQELIDSLCVSAKRGVDIDILLPGPHSDKRLVQVAAESAYGALLECGIRIWNFQPSMLHAKILTVDGMTASIGSANFNARSTELDEEINLVVFDKDLVKTLDRQFDQDLERSREIVPGRWAERPLRQRVLEQISRPLRHDI